MHVHSYRLRLIITSYFLIFSEVVGHAHMHKCIIILKNNSCEPIGYNTKISTDGVEWGSGL